MKQRQTLRSRCEGSKPDQWIEITSSPKRVRVVFGGKLLADSKRIQLLRENDRAPVYYFPMDDVRMEHLLPSEHTDNSPSKGHASYFAV